MAGQRLAIQPCLIEFHSATSQPVLRLSILQLCCMWGFHKYIVKINPLFLFFYFKWKRKLQNGFQKSSWPQTFTPFLNLKVSTEESYEISWLKWHRFGPKFASEIVTDKLRLYSAAAKKLNFSNKQVTKRWANKRLITLICRFNDENGQCFGLGVCIASTSSPQSTPRFTICLTHKDHSQNAVLSSLTVTLLSPSGVPHRKGCQSITDTWAP